MLFLCKIQDPILSSSIWVKNEFYKGTICLQGGNLRFLITLKPSCPEKLVWTKWILWCDEMGWVGCTPFREKITTVKIFFVILRFQLLCRKERESIDLLLLHCEVASYLVLLYQLVWGFVVYPWNLGEFGGGMGMGHGGLFAVVVSCFGILFHLPSFG